LLAGAPATFRLHYSAREGIQRAVFGIGFLTEAGVNVAGPNSGRVGSWSIDPGEGYVDFVVDELLLQPANYRVSAAIVDSGHAYDLVDRAYDLHVRGRGDQEPGLTRMPGVWKPPVSVGSTGPGLNSAVEAAGAE